MVRNNFSVARRSMWFVLRTLAIVIAVIALALGVFVGSMHMSNLYVLATEGMELRAGCIVTNGSTVVLAEHFTKEFIDGDSALYDGKYKEYIVNAYDYRIDVENISVMPWSTKASMTVIERMASMSGTPNDESDENVVSKELPPFITARYKIEFTSVKSRWYISGLTLIEENPTFDQLPTPNMELYVSPTASPTPTPALSPDVSVRPTSD